MNYIFPPWAITSIINSEYKEKIHTLHLINCYLIIFIIVNVEPQPSVKAVRTTQENPRKPHLKKFIQAFKIHVKKTAKR